MSEEKPKIRDFVIKAINNQQFDEKKLIELLENQRTKWLEDRRRQKDRIWQTNQAFYKGNHYIRERSRSEDNTAGRVRLKENHVNNTIQRIVSIVTQNMPVVRAFPSQDSFLDNQNAENCESYVKYIWRTKKLENLLGKWIKNSCIYGDGLIYPAWNPDLGDKLPLNPDETGDGKGEIREYRGDFEIEVDAPFACIPRPGYSDLDKMPDFIRQTPVSRESIEAICQGPVASEGVRVKPGLSQAVRVDTEMVMKCEYFHKPTHWFEEGCYIAWAGDKILKVIEFPYKRVKRLPLIKLPFDSIDGEFFAQASLDNLIDLQEQLNKAASMIVEARNLMARPRWWVSHEAEVAAQSITDRPGDILRYKLAGGKPEPITANFNFSELAAHKQDVRGAMGQVSGVTGASRGEIPSSARTALALQLVLEQDRSQFLPFIKEMHQGVLDLMLMLLNMAAQYIPEEDPRTIKIEGPSGIRLFHGKMVPSELDLYLEDTNPLGWTAGSRIESTIELVNAGVVKDSNQALEMLKLNSTDPAFRLVDISKVAAEKENAVLMQGKILDPLNEDDDEMHLEVHLRLARSFEYRQYPQAVKDAIDYHVEKHKERARLFHSSAALGQPHLMPGPIDAAGLTEAVPAPRPELSPLLQQ